MKLSSPSLPKAKSGSRWPFNKSVFAPKPIPVLCSLKICAPKLAALMSELSGLLEARIGNEMFSLSISPLADADVVAAIAQNAEREELSGALGRLAFVLREMLSADINKPPARSQEWCQVWLEKVDASQKNLDKISAVLLQMENEVRSIDSNILGRNATIAHTCANFVVVSSARRERLKHQIVQSAPRKKAAVVQETKPELLLAG